MKKLAFYLFLLAGLISSCDKVDDPFKGIRSTSLTIDGVEHIVEKSLGINDSLALVNFISNNTWVEKTSPDNDNTRFIVLEEFTGHTCTFCPNGTREIKRLDGIFGDQLIPISIHAGNFAVPAPNGNKYTTDFRVPEGRGEIYINEFNVSGYPSGIVSRIKQNASGAATWEQDINSIKDDIPMARLVMTNYYSSQRNVIRCEVEINWKQTLAEEYNLQLFLLEDNIIDWQLDNGVEKPDYNHRHVLRKVINDTFGKTLEPAVSDETVKFQYIFTTNAAWKPADLEVVAFVFNRDNSSYEVIQANAVHVQ